MKHLFLLLLLSTTAFSQVRSVFATPQLSDYKMTLEVRPRLDTIPPYCNTAGVTLITYRPDTVRAIILVTMSPNGIAHARMGFVVIEQGKRPVYLDCRKRALKRPQVGWGYEIVNPNKEK